MGYLQALEMKENLELDQLLHCHLQYNHFPPIHSIFIDTAKTAIELANYGDWDTRVNLPNGKILTVAEIIEQLHLETFLNNDDEYGNQTF
jgi:hypothetical protein